MASLDDLQITDVDDANQMMKALTWAKETFKEDLWDKEEIKSYNFGKRFMYVGKATFKEDRWDKEEIKSSNFGKRFIYAGFDPKRTLKLLLHRGRSPVKGSFTTDMCWLIALAVETRNSITKINSVADPATKEVLENMKTNYNIVEKAQGQRDEITLTRISLVFPWITCHYMKRARNPTVTPSMLGVPNLPICICTPAFSALIPKAHKYTQVLKQTFLLFQLQFYKIINPGKTLTTENDKEEWLKNAKNYLTISMNSGIITEEEKIGYLRDLKVLIKDRDTEKVDENVIIASHLFETRMLS